MSIFRRLCLISLCLAPVALFCACSHSSAQDRAARRTNVLFISIDDLNNDLGAYGHPVIRSPHIDRLARRGVRFDRAYCQLPWCNPSRISLLSGKRPETTGVFDLRPAPREVLPETIFLPQLFRRGGYFTASVGKIYHDGKNDPDSWDLTEPGRTSNADEQAAQAERARRQPLTAKGLNWAQADPANGELGDEIVARRVIELMEERARDGRPFFLAAGFRKPHLPWVAPKSYYAMYPLDRIALPAQPTREQLALMPEVARRTELSPAVLGDPSPLDLSDREKREAIAAYYASTSFMDAQVGRLLAALDRLKLWENTVVVLFSDHGFHLGDHGNLWAKNSLFERATRVPLIIAAPGIAGGKVSARTVELLDLYPTLAELCGLPAPDGLEGRSLVSLLNDPTAAWDRPAYTVKLRTELNPPVMGRSVRTERWRYTEWDDGRAGVELYDHANDPREHRNLAGDPGHAETIKALRGLLSRQARAAEHGE